MAEDVPICFDYGGKQYSGVFHLVSGTGYQHMWHLYINHRYFGDLRYTDNWDFGGKELKDLGEFFGAYLISWYDCH